ncbi:Loki-CTERM sorting domain-containing protein [Chloroflexota bacterium]
MRTRAIILLVLVLCLALARGVLAASSTNYSLPFSATASGGNERTSTSYDLTDTGGQAATGVSTSTNYHLSAGFIGSLAGVADEHNWESYSSQWVREDNFSGSTNHVYMKGVGFDTTGTYKIAYYDGGTTHDGADGTQLDVDLYTDIGDGILDESERLLTSYGSSSYGTWHAVVYKTTGDMPDSYDLVSSSDPGYVVEDSFYVEQSAIPEFPTVLTVIIAMALCAGIYLWMRKRRLAYVKD